MGAVPKKHKGRNVNTPPAATVTDNMFYSSSGSSFHLIIEIPKAFSFSL